MIIRITEKSEGIEDYFETGQKSGREKSRDELDKRVHLSGDLDTFSIAVNFTNKAKEWKNHYWHITGSFALEDQDISDEKVKEIHQEMLRYYFCRYTPDRIIHASEIHRPKIQTGAIGQQRFIHFHMAVSKYDQKTGNQIRMIPYRHSSDKAFQSYLALKYGLEDPANHKRPLGKPSVENLVAMQTGKDPKPNGPEKKTLHRYKEEVSRLLEGVSSVDEAKTILGDQKDITSIIFKKLRKKDPETGKLVPGNKYLQIKSSQFPKTRSINLRGKGFEALEKLYYTSDELEERIIQGKYVPPETPDNWKDLNDQEQKSEIETQRAIFRKHQSWWLGEARKLKKKQVSNKINYKKIEKKYTAKFEERIKEQHVYFVIYQHNIRQDQIRGYSIWEKNNTRFLVNNDKGVKIYDRPDKIVLDTPKDPEKRKEAIALALSIAQNKGWDLGTMKITGSQEFVKETKRQIAEIIKSETFAMENVEPTKAEPVKPKPYLNAVHQLKTDQAEKKNRDQLPKSRISKIKTELVSQVVIDLAIEKCDLSPYHYITAKGNKIRDKRTKRSWNAIDFLTKVCNQPIAGVFPILDDLLNAQETRMKEIRTKLDPQAVIDLAMEKFGRSPDAYAPIEGNKIKIKGTKKYGNVVAFLTKICGKTISEAFPMLDDLLKAQEEKERRSVLILERDELLVPFRKPQEPLFGSDATPETEDDAPDDLEDDQDDDYGFRM